MPLLLACCVATLGAGTAWAADTLVSNLGQTSDSDTDDLSSNDFSQAFTTGATVDPYTITGVKVKFATVPSATSTVSAFIADGLGAMDTIVANLTNPGTWSTTSTFGVPAGTTLAANTTYYFVIEGDDGQLTITFSDSEDMGGVSGWTIANDRDRRGMESDTGLGGTWLPSSVARQIAIEGDITAPALQGAQVSTQNTRVNLFFDEVLDSTSLPATSAFTVKVEGTVRSVSSRAFNSNVDGVRLVVSPAIRPGETVTVSYTKPSSNPLKDAADNEVESFTDEAVTNLLAAAVPEAPGSLTATPVATDDTKMDLTWTTPWHNGSDITKFQVRHEAGTSVSASTTWDDITGSGPTTTGHQVTGLTGETEYTFEVRAVNGEGNGAEAAVTQTTTDNTAPTLTSARISGVADWLVLTYDEKLDTTSTPDKSAFTVKVEEATRTIAAVAVLNQDSNPGVLVLTLGSAVRPGETVTVSYAVPSTNPIRDLANNEAAAFTDQAVSNLLAATAPEAPGNLVATATHADKVALTWDTPWDNGSAITRFEHRSVAGNTVPASVSWTAIPDSGPATTGLALVGLAPGTEYAVEIRAVNDEGNGAEAAATATTLTPTWSFHLLPFTTGAEKLTEGGASRTAQLVIANDVRFAADQTITLKWGDDEISGGLIQGANGSAAFAVDAGDREGELEISAPDRPGDLYRPPETKNLTANLGGEQVGNSVALEFVDDEAKPVATMVLRRTSLSTSGVSRLTVVEGDNLYPFATLSRGYDALIHPGMKVEITGTASKFVSSDIAITDGKTEFVLPFHPASATEPFSSSLGTVDNSTAGDSSEHVFTIVPNPDYFTIGSPSSATLTILDNDVAPTAPRNLRAQARDGSVVLTWDPPTSLATTEFTAYELRHVAGSSPGGTFADISTDPDTGSHTVTGLTNETEYTFELRAKNSFGSSSPVSVSKTPRVGVAVSFAEAAASVDEGQSVSVTVTLGEAPTASVTVPIADTPGAGFDSNEYSGVPSNVTFNAGQTSRSFTVATVDDADDEPDRTLTLSLGLLPDGYVPGENDALILTIADNDVPMVSASFGAAAASVAEGVPYDVAVGLSQPPEREVVLPIRAARGANLAADEVEGVPESVTFAADETEKSFEVTFVDDAVEEGNETLTLTFGTFADNRVMQGEHPQLVLTATDDDGPPSAPDVSVQTGDGYAALSWQPVANDSPILRYEVRWKEDGGAFTAWVSAGTDTSYRAEGLANGKAHEFQVRAVNEHGDGESASAPGTPSERVTRIPTAPQNLHVRATDSSRAELRWGQPANGTDEVITRPGSTMSEIQGYRIEVCRTACGGADAEWYAVVANTGEFKHTYVHQVLAPGVIRENRYRVRAININGKAGPWSNTATLDPTELGDVYLQTPDDSTLWVRLKVRNPDGNPLHVRYENTGPVRERDGNTGTGTVGYAEHRLTKKGDVTLVLRGLDAGSWYRVDLDFASTFDSERLQTHRYGTARAGETPLTSPYELDLLDAQVYRSGTWREAADAQLSVRMGESGRYRVRLKPCSGERTVHVSRTKAPAGALRASPMDADPLLMSEDCADDGPGAWREVSVSALALAGYPADTRAEALLRAPFAVVYKHEVWRPRTTTESILLSKGVAPVRILVDRPEGATLPVPDGVTIASDTRVMSWDAVPGASNYLVVWRYGPRYSDRANTDRSRQTDTSVTLPLGPSGRGPITARVRAYSASAVSDWSDELTWDSRAPTLSVLDTAVNEDDGSVGFLVKLEPAASGTVTVDYATADGTAVSPADYAATSGTLTFAPGERERKTALVPIVDDDEEDSGETFSLLLSSPTGSDANNGAAVLGDAEAVATILNSEAAPAELTGFTLVDAGNNTDLMALADGSTVRLGELLTVSSYGIRANLGTGAAPGSVRIELSGAKTAARTDDAAPYSLYGDGGGRINGGSLPAGSYALTATAYANSGGQGDELGALTVSFTVAPGELATTTPGPFEVAEGTTAVATLAATETGAGGATTWSIPDGAAGGADGEAFALTADGALSFAMPKDFEAPDDADGDGIYAVTVEMAAGEQTATADLVVTLTGVNEAPTAKASASPAKVRGGIEVTLDATGSTDPDAGDTLTYAWTQTEDGPRLTLSDASVAKPTFTSPSDLEAETVFAFTLEVTDAGGLHAEATATVTVTTDSEISIAAAADYATEGGAAVFRLTRIGNAANALTVPVTVSETGAMLGDAPANAAFAAGARETDFEVPTAADADVENDSVVTAEIAAGAGWTVDASTASVTVLDDDAAPVSTTSAADVTVWSADMQVVEYGTGSIGAGSADLFSNQQGRAGLRAKWLWWDPPARTIKIAFDDGLDDADLMTLHVGDLSVTFPNPGGDSSFDIPNVDVSWTDGETLAARVSKPSDAALSTDATLKSLTVSDAELAPAFAAETLVYRAAVAAETATVAASATDDGAAVTYGSAEDADAELADHQVAVPATGDALVDVAVTAEDGTVRRYRVLIARAAGESANTAPTGLPAISGTAEVGATLTASADDIGDADGLDDATFAYRWRANGAAIDGATGTTYEVRPGDVGKTLDVRVTFTDDGGTAETLDSAATEAVVDNRPTVTSVAIAEPPAGGWTDGDAVRLSIGFSAPVTVSTDGGTPSLALSLDGAARDAAYAGGTGTTSLTFSYAVEAADGTVTAVSAAADALAANGGAIRDADGRDANLAHAAFEITAEAGETEEPAALTASFPDMPATHDGSGAFTFRVAFSEDVGIGYATMRDDAFEVDEGDATGARRIDGRHDLWEITVEPDGREAVTVTLHGERACGETGAVCTRGEDPRPLSNSPSATVAGPTVAVVPTVAIADAGGTEGDGDIAFAVTLDGAATGTVTVDYATSDGTADGDDYTATSGTLTFDAGTTRKTITVTIADDDVNESEETFTVTLSNASGATLGTAGATGTIRNRAVTPTLSIAGGGGTEGDDDDIAFAVTLDRAAAGTVTVDYATSNGTADGDDYTASSGTLSFAAGETEKTVSVAIGDDVVNEDDETFTVTLSNASGATLGTGTATGTIRNRYITPTAGISGGSGTEGDDDAIAFTVTLDRTSTAVVTVDYATSDGTATAGDDYTATSGTLSFAAGETENAVSVAIGDDVVNEDDETFTVTLSNASGAALGTASATGTIENRHVVPLTASFEQVPAEHDGTTFVFHVRFSEDPAVSYSVLRDESFDVTGGEVDKARRKDGRDDLREIHVEPSGHGDVTVSLPPTTDCDADGAICTADGRPLSNANAATVRAMPALSVADATATEGAGATLDFAVTLSRAASGPVTVAYATADGTAVAGSDYTAVSDTLSFAAGETSKTVRVALLDDSVDDDGETLTLTLSNPSGARLADATATGTIDNSDPVPQAWLVRFGRTAADHAIDAIGVRFEGGGETAHATFAGRRLWGGVPGADPLDADNDPFGLGTGIGSGSGHDASPYARQPGTYGAQPGMGMNAGSGMGMNGMGMNGMSAGAGMNAGMGGGMNAGAGMGAGMGPGGGMGTGMGVSGAGGGPFGPPAMGGHRPALRDLLIGSSFLLSASGTDDAGGGRRLTAWGRASATRFDGAEDDVRLDGDVATFLIGADAAWDRWLAGISVAHSIGSGGFSGGADEGELDSTLTAVHPYVRVQATDRLSAWGVLGYGAGSLGIETGDSAWRTDTSMSMAAAGLRGVLLSTDAGLELAAKTDARFTHIGSDAAVGDAGLLSGTAGGTSRVRLLLEGSRPFAFGPARVLTPTLQLGVRRDGGDAETGTGFDLGGTLRYADAALGLSVEASGRYLLAHEDSAYREWGASASIRVDPGIPGRGLTLSVVPSWGADASGGAERLWSARDARGLAGYGFDTDMRLAAQVGYGFAAFKGKGSMTPFAALSSSGPSGRELRAGALWARGQSLQMSLAGTRREAAGERPAHGVEFRLTWRPGGREGYPGATGGGLGMDAPCPAGGAARGDESGIGPAPACAPEPETRRAAPRGD